MIIIDYSHISTPMIANAWRDYVKKAIPFEQGYRIYVLKTLHDIMVQHHRSETEPVILAIDSRQNWRKDYFSLYKYKRKEKRQKSDINWELAFRCYDDLLQDIKDHFMFEVIAVDKMEGDDIIGVIAEYESPKQETIKIISNDKDFIQLHGLGNITQFDRRGIEVINDDPDYLLKQVLIGDRLDDVPSVLVDTKDILTDQKAKPFNVKTAQKVIDGVHKRYKLEDLMNSENFKRNQLMIDLSFIPDEYKRKVIDKHLNHEIKGSIEKIENFLMTRIKTGKSYSYMASRFIIEKEEDQGLSLFEKMRKKWSI